MPATVCWRPRTLVCTWRFVEALLSNGASQPWWGYASEQAAQARADRLGQRPERAPAFVVDGLNSLVAGDAAGFQQFAQFREPLSCFQRLAPGDKVFRRDRGDVLVVEDIGIDVAIELVIELGFRFRELIERILEVVLERPAGRVGHEGDREVRFRVGVT